MKYVTVMGEKLSQKEYPNLYDWAKDQPDTLERQVKKLLEKVWKNKKGSLGMCLINLEMDLVRAYA